MLGATILVDFCRYLHRSGERLFDLSSLIKFCKNGFSLTFLKIVSIPRSNIYFTTEALLEKASAEDVCSEGDFAGTGV